MDLGSFSQEDVDALVASWRAVLFAHPWTTVFVGLLLVYNVLAFVDFIAYL